MISDKDKQQAESYYFTGLDDPGKSGRGVPPLSPPCDCPSSGHRPACPQRNYSLVAPSPLPLLPPVKTPAVAAPVSCSLLLEVWKNQAGWNWHMKAPGWVLFNAPDTRYRSRSDAQHAGERAASQLNITITEIKVR